MAAIVEPDASTEQRVILHNVSWQTYERLLAEQQDSAAIRLNYDRGVLEIMILSLRHERLRHLFITLVEFIASERDLDVEGVGSTTFRRDDLGRGAEPDAAFYLHHAAQIRTRDTLDPRTDPTPELVIEIDISHGSLDKLPIYGALGVTEVWRYADGTLTVHGLSGDGYTRLVHSELLGGIRTEDLDGLIAAGQRLTRRAWFAEIRRVLTRADD